MRVECAIAASATQCLVTGFSGLSRYPKFVLRLAITPDNCTIGRAEALPIGLDKADLSLGEHKNHPMARQTAVG